jgi:IS30 family transposase
VYKIKDKVWVLAGPAKIDLVYMSANWFNHNYKYLLTCVDVFSKLADIIPLKDRNQDTVTDAFSKILTHMAVPARNYSDQGIEFKNATFQKLLDKHNIKIIFALGHAPFVEAFNKNIKGKFIKYMKLNNTKNWSTSYHRY